ncbi:MAG: Ig-like domain-containing protein [Cyanobacteriota bacterium]
MRYSSSSVSPSRLVVLDAGVDSVQSLAAGAVSGVEVLVLRSDDDGLERVSEAIAARPGLAELHIVAHGCPGSLRLGNGYLNLQTLRETPSILQGWGQGKGDWAIALYGCQVAAGDAGAEFLERLHHLTGATISASTRVVGHADLGGTWDLDVAQGIGPVPGVVIDESVRRSYSEVFPDLQVQTEANSILTGDLESQSLVLPLPTRSDLGARLTLDPDGQTFTYNPRDVNGADPDIFRKLAENESEIDEFSYEFVDGTLTEWVVEVEVIGVNDAPVASNFSIGIGDPPLLKTETFVVNDTTNSKSLRQNATDIDHDDDDLDFSGSETSSRGAKVEIDAEGTYTYDPTEVDEIQQIPDGQTITDTFQYTVTDPDGLTDSGTVTVQIRGENTPVVANNDPDEDKEIKVGRGESVSIPVLANDNNIEGGPITILDFDASTENGGSISQDGDSLVYRAPSDFIGEDTFNYVAANLGGSDSATVTITVNTPPSASNETVFSQSAAQPIRIAVLENDSDPDEPFGDTISVKSTDELPRRGGRLSILSTGEILYTAPDGYNGPNRFQYTIEDSLGATDSATVIINPPQAQDDASRTRPDQVLRIPVLDNDEVFSNVSIVAFETEGLNEGSITRDGDQLVYVAEPGFEGFDYFDYTIEDIDGNRSTATVEVLVSPDVRTPEEQNPAPEENPLGNLGSTLRIPPVPDRNPNPTADRQEVPADSEDFVLIGNANANTLIARDGVNNALAGLEGNDNIFGGTGNDTLFGNQGNDFISPTGGNNVIFGGAGDDYIESGPGNDTIHGDRGNDLIKGSSADNLIFGESGVNRIDGGSGNDTVVGGIDADIITGNFGNDVLVGGSGNDLIQGGDGNDIIFGNQGDDLLDGSRGDDTVYGGQGNDTIYGSAGNNRLKGDLGNDVLFSGSGADSFVLEVPDDGSVDLILNFSSQQGDKLVVQGGFTASDIIVQPSGGNSLIRIANTDITLAVLQSTPFDAIGPEDFVFE